LNGTGSPGEINEIAASGSGSGTAYVPAINVTYPDAGQFYGRQAYIRGYLSVPDNGTGPAAVTIGGKSVPNSDGSFGLVVSKDDVGFANQADAEPWQVEIDALYPNGQKLIQIVKLIQANDASKAHGLLPAMVNPGFAELLLGGDASLDIGPDALDQPLDIKITPLAEKDLPALDPGMTNVTPAPKRGYRFTPHGAHFKKDIKVTIPYDPALIPAGLTETDVKTFYFDTTQGHWVELARFNIDSKKHKVTSFTNHFTDMISATLTTPDHPETTSFNATQMKDIKAADPGAGINLIEPPKPNNMGDARLSYPIEIPQGRQGMQPQLGIQYNSSGGNGWLGLGWDLSVPSITIDTRWGVPRYDANKETETYSLNGEMLTPVAHRGALQDRSTGDKVFHTRVEGGFRRIIRHGNAPANYWWEVTDKNGMKNFYGGTGASQDAGSVLGGDKGIFRWALKKTVDTHGNTVSYSYAKVSDSGVSGGATGYQLYVKTIAYTGQGSSDGPYAVSFKRDRDLGEPRRTDVQIDARGGFKQVTADLLRKIEVRYNTNLLRSYELVYKPGAFNKTLLDHVVQYGSDGSKFNQHSFAYYDEARDSSGNYLGFAPAASWAVGGDSVSTLDLFGNGSVSALGGNTSTGEGGGIYIGIGFGTNSSSKEETGGIKLGYSQSQSDTLLVMADMNGDGLPDKVFKRGGSLYYRPNLSGPYGSPSFGDPVALPTLLALGADNVTSTTIGGELYFGLAVMLDRNESYTQSDTYISDVNGDGIPDLVSGGQVLFGYVNANGVPTFSPNSADTPVTVGAGTLITQGLLADPAAIEAKRAASFPLLDTVHRWVAPYDGVISINAPVQLIQDTSPARAQYKNADGVRVAIQQEGAELWSARIQATDYAVKTPGGVSSIRVKKGDRLYFRVQSIFDGSYDLVAWDPEITYLNVDAIRLDANNLPVYRYRASQDFTLAGRSTTVTAPLTGTLHLAGTLTKSAATSDDVKLVVYQNGTAVYTVPLAGAQTGSFVINQDLPVKQLDKLQWRIETDSPIDATLVQLTPQAWYTAAQGVTQVQDQKGNYVLQLHPAYSMDLYPADNLVAPQDGYVVQKSDINADGTVSVSATASSATLANGQNLPLVFTVKRAATLLGKSALTLAGNGSTTVPASAGATLKVAAQAGDTLYFDFSSRNTAALTLVDTYEVRVGKAQGNNPPPLVPSLLHVPTIEGLLPQPYRGWGAFGYNGNSPRDAQAIDQSLLTLSNINTGACSASNTSACATAASSMLVYAYAPDPATLHWGGPDASAWVSAAGASSTRLGLKNIRMPRGEQFAGSSAPPRMSHSISDGLSVGVGGSSGTSESQIDFQDLNGDRFPDVLSQGGVQYTGMTGGLDGAMGGGIGSARNTSNTSYSASSTGVASIGAVIAKATGFSSPTGTGTGTPSKNDSAEPSFGLSGNIGGGTSDAESDLIDVNGDGLPDKVSKDGSVMLNMGYSFVPDGNWSGGPVNKGETLNGGMNLGFSMDHGSIAGGLSLSIGDSHTNETYVDINGDGLPDKITGSGPFSVRLNTGAGFAPAITWAGGQGGIARDKNVSLGGGANFTFGFSIWDILVVFNPDINFTTSVGRPELAFRDVDGDGFADQAYSLKDDHLSVAINQIGRTNILKSVTRPLGAKIDLEYTRDGNRYEMPQSRWVMSRVLVDDGHPNDGVDVQETTYRYTGGNYNRLERDFYGYQTVVEEHRSNHSVYRKVTNTYLNANYYAKGLEADELTTDGSGSKYLETVNTYTLRDLNTGSEVAVDDAVVGSSTVDTIFPMLVKSERRFYEGGQGSKGTYTTHVYDALGNITDFFDAGDAGSADDVEAIINYSTACTDSYVVGKPTTIDVIGAASLMRTRIGKIDCATGNLTQLSQDLGNGTVATTDLTYEANGNLKTITGPANIKGQRYALSYVYDTAVATYVASVTDSFGYTSGATYDYSYGKPLSSTDLNNNVIGYVYDNYGRTTSVKGPYEQGGSNKTLVFAYHPEAAVPYATTQHLNLDAKGTVQAPIETVLFTDGLKRVLQTKKSVTVNGTAMLDVSGHVEFDAMGRTIKQYYPVTEPLGTDGSFNPASDSVTPTVTVYDVLDRTVQTTLPDTTTTSIEYGFGSDRNGVNQFKTTVTDANKKTKESYRDVRELITSVAEHNKGATLWTSYSYDPLKQITEVSDAKGNLTRATYDNLGRRTSLSNPDTGKTVTVYDTASNVVQKITANLAASGKAINYDYEYNRLIAIHYPDYKGNDVAYTYGAAGLNSGLNQIGRITKVTDATGTEERAYGKLGETVKEIRTIASHTQGKSANSPEVYTTQYHYDTFGRLMTLTLPDTEIITYGYDAGGNLATFAGDKQGNHTQYLQSLLYDKFEQRTYLKLGNGVETNYTYRADNRRLKNLMSQGSVAGKFQNLGYSYDNVGNILGLKNDTAIPAPSGMGGPTSLSYGYDDLYRLTSASGTFQSSPDKTRNYTLAMGFDDIHNIVQKTQADNLTNAAGQAIPQKATSYDWAYAYGGSQPHAPTHIGSHTFSYDADGNQLGWTDDKNGTRRIMLWDEDNRIAEIDDNGERSKYTYDAKGERIIKVARQGETVYVNQYYVVRNRSIVSKHFFAGTSRIATRMVMGTAPGNGGKGSGPSTGSTSSPQTGSGQAGSTGSTSSPQTGGGQSGSHAPSTASGQGQGNSNQGNAYGQSKDNPGQGNGNGNAQAADHGKSGTHGNGNSNSLARNAGEGGGEGAVNLPGNSEKGLENALANGQGNKYGIYKHLAKEGDTVDASGDIVSTGSTGSTGTGTGNQAAASGQSDFTYYYHPDHLGSTGYVTDANGKLYEHLEYFPFGETWVQEHSNTLRTPYLFTGKEFDQETGLYYFGARYYDPRTSVWQSADPIIGKYLPSGGSSDQSKLVGMGGIFNPLNLAMYTYGHQN
jgi:RHS repeat-associated protein